MQARLDQEEQDFVTRVKAIRGKHILLLEYDRQMLDALTVYRDRLRDVVGTGDNVTLPEGTCGGKALEDMRLVAEADLDRLRGFILNFERALRDDPQGVYVSDPVAQ